MAERIVELRWDCRDCDAKGILGRHKRCPSCGSPREKGEMKMDGLDAPGATVTDPELLKLAAAGHDWFCIHCESGNIGNGDRCASCGAPRYGVSKENHPDVVAWIEDPEDGSRRPVDPPPPRPKAPVQRRSHDREDRAILFALAVTIGTLISGVMFWATRTHDVIGSVVEVSWKHTTYQDRWQDAPVRRFEHETVQTTGRPPTNGSGEMPGMVLLGDCRMEHHHYEEYQCGTKPEDYECGSDESYTGTCSEPESYTDTCSDTESYDCGETCSDNGNGFATCRTRTCTRSVSVSCTKTRYVDKPCTKTRYVSKTCQREVPKYCDRSIERMACDYLTQEWATVDVRTIGGSTLDTTWDMPSLGALDRVSYAFDYGVVVEYEGDDGPERFEIDEPGGNEPFLGRVSRTRVDAATVAFKEWAVGRPVYLKVNNLGGVASHSLVKP